MSSQPLRWELFSGVPEEDLRRVLAIARRRTFGRNEVVFHEADPAETLHLVVNGRFAMARRLPLGQEALLSIRGRGDAFGELALVSPMPRSATASSLDEGETLSVHRHDFDELRRRFPSVDRMLVTILAAQLRRMNERLAEAFYESAEHRVLRRLVELARLDGEIRLTQEQLASLAGASRATVNSVLSAERRRGSISLRRGVVLVHDPDGLARRARLRPDA